jgi:hypothetical protein
MRWRAASTFARVAALVPTFRRLPVEFLRNFFCIVCNRLRLIPQSQHQLDVRFLSPKLANDGKLILVPRRTALPISLNLASCDPFALR